MVTRRDIFVGFCAIVLTLAFIPIFTYIYFAKDLKSKEAVMNKNDVGAILLDTDNKPFYSFYSAKQKQYLPIGQTPMQVRQAVIAAEDKEFYRHPGFSVKAIIGAVIADIKQKDFSYGGSTITQQLVKNSLLNSNKNVFRKFQEVVLAQEIERRYSKDEILEMYLNSVYFGQGAFGVEEASQIYFSKSTKELNLAEITYLIGLLPAPSKYSPYNDQEAGKKRQRVVLEQMKKMKFIDDIKVKQTADSKLTFNDPDEQSAATVHFALLAKQELISKYGEEEISRSGFKVYTTLNTRWQEYAQEAVRQQVNRLQKNRVNNGAAVVLQKGEIKALVGSTDWSNPQFGKVNVAVSKRPPGSAFKPVVYAAAFENRVITPATGLKDEPVTINIAGSAPYRPVNYDRRFRGVVTPRRALANSLNVPSVEVLGKVGIPKTLEMAQRMGITTLKSAENYGPSLVLGTGEVELLQLTAAYGVFANGLYNKPTTIRKIVDKYGNTVYESNHEGEQVLDPAVAFLVSSILSDTNSRSEVFGNALNISRTAAVKTGTTEDYKDAWTIGYTPSLTIGVWIGNNDNKPMDNVAGSLGAAPIWKALMEKFLPMEDEKFISPEGIVSRNVCIPGTGIREATSSGYIEYFIKGTEPQTCVRPSSSPIPVSSPTGSKNPQPKNPNPDIKPEVKKEKN